MIEKRVLFEWFEEDMNVILDDYAQITQRKLRRTCASCLSPMETIYQLAKGGKRQKIGKQPFSDVLAKQRA